MGGDWCRQCNEGSKEGGPWRLERYSRLGIMAGGEDYIFREVRFRGYVFSKRYNPGCFLQFLFRAVKIYVGVMTMLMRRFGNDILG